MQIWGTNKLFCNLHSVVKYSLVKGFTKHRFRDGKGGYR